MKFKIQHLCLYRRMKGNWYLYQKYESIDEARSEYVAWVKCGHKVQWLQPEKKPDI